MATYSSIQVLPITSVEPKDKTVILDETDRSSKGYLADYEENGIAENEKVNCSPKASSLCNSRNSNSTCITISNEVSAQLNWKLKIFNGTRPFY